MLLWTALASAIPIEASSETCVFAAGASQWGPIERIEGSGVAGSCTPDASDTFRIPAGAEVSVVDEIAFDPAVFGAGIEVLSGGSLDVSVTDAALRLAVGSDGLQCRSGSTCRFTNRYRGYGVEAGRLLESPGSRWHFRVGEVVPCDGDCDATPELVAIRYESEADRRSLLAVEPGEVLCFFDPKESDVWVSPDSGQCYEIVGTRTDGPPYELVFDVHQGSSDPVGWPLARRELKRTTLAVGSASGARDIALAPSNAISADREHVARWLRFGDAQTGVFEDVAYKIQDSVDGDPDVVRIGDLRGVRGGRAAGTPVVIDYGWRRGDPFFVSVPVVVTSATASRLDSEFIVNGNYRARGLILDHMWGPRVDSDAAIELHEDVWVRDATSSGTGVSLQLTNRGDETLHRTLITGGIEGTDCAPAGSPPTTNCDTMHGLQVSCSTGLVIDGYSSRHLGDDNFVLDGDLCGDGAAHVEGLRWHCSFMGGSGGSASFVDPAGFRLEGSSFTDLVADDCVSSNAAALSGIGRESPPPIDVANIVLWGLRGGGGGGDFLAHNYRVQNLTALGIAPGSPNVALMPNHVENFVVRESRSATTLPNSVVALGTLEMRRGFVRDIELARSNFQALRAVDGSVIEDVAVLNVTTTGSCSNGCAFVAPYAVPPSLPGTNASWTLRHALLGYWGIPGQAQSGVTFPWPEPGPGTVIGALWLTGFGTGQAAQAAFPAPASFGGPAAPTFDAPLCFFSNGRDVPTGFAIDGDPELIGNLDPGFSDGIGGAIELPSPATGTPCGFRGAIGLTTQNWALSKSGLLPESIGGEPRVDAPCSDGIDGDGDGLTDYPDDRGCSAPDDLSEQSLKACDNGVDDDGDGSIDYAADPGCVFPHSAIEATACQDGLDNDGEPGIDFDGGASANSGVALDVPDPDCGTPSRNTEGPLRHTGNACGLGFELVVPIALLLATRRRGIRSDQPLS
jgi:hypothetical protein